MKWKAYIRQIPIMTMMVVYPLVMVAKPVSEQDKVPAQPMSQIDSIKNVISHLSPEKLKQLRALYSETYGPVTEARLASSNPSNAYTPSQGVVHLDGKRVKSCVILKLFGGIINLIPSLFIMIQPIFPRT